MTNPEGGEQEIASPNTSVRRSRAPTITIDTSAVSASSATDAVPLRNLSDISPTGLDHAPALHGVDTPAQHTRQSSVELNSKPSFDSKQSRPTSPHNVLTPTAKGHEHSLLAVPERRSRVNSLDSDDNGRAPTAYSGETFIPTNSTPTEVSPANNHGSTSKTDEIINDKEALTPDPGTEDDFKVEDNKFAFSPGQLSKLVNPKSWGAFHALGGLVGIEKGLRSDRRTGLSKDETFLDGSVSFEEATAAAAETADPMASTNIAPVARTDTVVTTATSKKQDDNSFSDRRRVFKDNRLPEKKIKNIFQLAWIAFKDKVLIILTVAAVVSLSLGIYETVGIKKKPGDPPSVDWVEGVAIMAAVIIVVVVGAANDWQKERQFVKLNKKKEDRTIKVIRSGKTQEVSVYGLVVGDVVHLDPGDMVPVDGIFIGGHDVKCDESSATGESDLIKKHPADMVFRAIENHEDIKKMDPFIISGSKVTEGVGTFMVTSVGVHSSYGKIMMSLRDETETTPLQSKLNVLAEQIAKLGGAAALLLFIVLFIKFLVKLPHNHATASEKGQNFLQIFIVAVTIIVVAVPEGLPLAVTLALAFATTRMLKDNNLVRVLRACETMGNATTICSDKTGTLTQNKMTLVAGTVGTPFRFGDRSASYRNRPVEPSAKAKDTEADDNLEDAEDSEGLEDITPAESMASLNQDVKDLLHQSIVANSTAFEDDNGEFIGSKTETALLGFARDYLGMGPVNIERENAKVVQMVPFDSGRKCMACIVRLSGGGYRMYVKGASEIVLGQCTRIVRDPSKGIFDTSITMENLATLNRVISMYAERSLRTIGLVYRDFEDWPPRGVKTAEDDATTAQFDDIFREMIFLAIVGIQDPLREGVPEAVLTCQKAGVFVRMVTGDNLMTAKAIAKDCGIFTKGGVIMEGPQFRKLSRTRMDQVIPRLQVLARSSPEDKRILVKRLKEMGETVAVTGDGTNDAPALKTADVGFSMGIAGTEVAKEASAIILMDDNFSSIVKAIMWGRAVNDSVKKFLQFQVTVNITGVLLAFISAVYSSEEQSVLTPVQLLWVNLIMDTFAALALATDPPTRSILDRKPDPKSAPLITTTMWKMIIGQSIYQLAVTLTLYFGGAKILSYQTAHERDQLKTLVFNTFVWMQIFNQFNSRRLDNKFNILEGVTNNYFFMGINVILFAGQIMIIFVGGLAFSVTRLNGAQWGYSIVLGVLSIPMGVVIRLFPDALFERLIPRRVRRRDTPQLVVTNDDNRFEWNAALEEIREELTFMKKVRGGRLNGLKFKLAHPRETLLPRSRSNSTRSRSSSAPPQTPNVEVTESDSPMPQALTPDSRSRIRTRSRSNSAFGPAAAMAGIIAGSIAGWSPIDRSAQEDNSSMKFPQSGGREDLESQSGMVVHPDTDAQDPVVVQEPVSPFGVPPSQDPGKAPAGAS